MSAALYWKTRAKIALPHILEYLLFYFAFYLINHCLPRLQCGRLKMCSGPFTKESMGNDLPTSKGTVKHTKARAHEANEARWNTSVVASGECSSVETLP